VFPRLVLPVGFTESRKYCLVYAKSSPWDLPFTLKSTMRAPVLASLLCDLGLGINKKETKREMMDRARRNVALSQLNQKRKRCLIFFSGK
jgi:hypothetical protein